MSPLEFVLFGVACYLFGLVSGALIIPWLVDHGLFPCSDLAVGDERHAPAEYRWARQVSAVLLIAVVVLVVVLDVIVEGYEVSTTAQRSAALASSSTVDTHGAVLLRSQARAAGPRAIRLPRMSR